MNTIVIKRNKKEEPFDITRIENALSKAFSSCHIDISAQEISELAQEIQLKDKITVEEISDQVEETLVKHNYYKVAKAYILYRYQHQQSRFIKERIDYMNKYSHSSSNAATASETDSNSNVTVKNVANLEGEVYKTTNRIIQRQRMKDKLKELFPEVAEQYEKDLEHHTIYSHDESTSPSTKFYTYSPFECVEIMYNGNHYLLGLKSLYNIIQIPEVLEDPNNEVWCKYPKNLQIMDKDNWVNVTRITRKKRHRDLYRIKTAFGEDIIVTDNHPMIVAEDPNNTITAINSLNEKQFRTENKLTFDGITEIDLAQYIECDKIRSNFIATHESQAPYYFAKRYIKLDRSLGYIVGFFIGDGNYNNTTDTISFTQKGIESIIKLEEALFESLGVVSYECLGTGNSTGIYKLHVCSRVVNSLFKDYFGIKDKASNKCLPLNLLTFNEEFAFGIIEGLIDADGTVQDNNRIQIRLSSRECIMQLTKLLRHFGYNVANTHQSTPFSNNTRIKSNYDIWGIQFTNQPGAKKFDQSYKFQQFVTKETTKYLKYSTGWTTITDVYKVENGSFLDKCEFIYDITTESRTFDCNNLWVHNCQAISSYPLLLEGSGNIDGVTPGPPNDIQSFSGQITNLVFLLSSQCRGAVAIGDYFVSLSYCVNQEFGADWYKDINKVTTSENCLKQHTIKDCIRKGMKQFIYGVNQPAGNRSYNSPFSNIQYCDKYYFKALFEDYYYPDGTKPVWEAIDTLQRIFMELHRELRLIKPLTFPVTTISLLHDGTDVIDKEYKQLCADEWAKGGSFFCYLNDNPSVLSSCCRVQNQITDNVFNSTIGLIGLMTGSCNVITLNLNRIIQDWKLEWKEENKKSLKKYLVDILERIYKYQIAFKTMLYEMEDLGMFSCCNANYIKMSKLYCTIGIIGYCEAAQYLGLKVNNNPEYKEFLEFIFNVIKEENKAHSIYNKKRPFVFNCEAIPGEDLAVKLYNWDKADGYKVPEDQNLYSSYFFLQWDKDISVLDKLKLHGGEVAKACSGGQACHIHLDAHLSSSQYSHIIDFCIKHGVNYFTFNIPVSECKDCGHVVSAPITKCPVCQSENIDWWLRIIGFLRPLSSYSDARKIEAEKRILSKNLE